MKATLSLISKPGDAGSAVWTFLLTPEVGEPRPFALLMTCPLSEANVRSAAWDAIEKPNSLTDLVLSREVEAEIQAWRKTALSNRLADIILQEVNPRGVKARCWMSAALITDWLMKLIHDDWPSFDEELES